MITVALGDHGGINHVIDDTGEGDCDASSRNAEGDELSVSGRAGSTDLDRR